jgi:hypothetical protein
MYVLKNENTGAMCVSPDRSYQLCPEREEKFLQKLIRIFTEKPRKYSMETK